MGEVCNCVEEYSKDFKLKKITIDNYHKCTCRIHSESLCKAAFSMHECICDCELLKKYCRSHLRPKIREFIYVYTDIWARQDKIIEELINELYVSPIRFKITLSVNKDSLLAHNSSYMIFQDGRELISEINHHRKD